MASRTVYVELPDEGVDVWAPVLSLELDYETFQLPYEAPDDQRWAFAPGSVVRCEWRDLEAGKFLVATQLVGGTR